MFIIFEQFDIKADYTEEDVLKLFNETAIPIHRSLPGCISYDLLRYVPDGTGTVRWGYCIMTVWESQEYLKKARQDGKIRRWNSDLQETGFFEKFIDMRINYYNYRFSIDNENNPFM